MPSKLGQPGGQEPDKNRSRLIKMEGPFRGYRPSLNPAFAGLETAAGTSNLILRNGAWTWDYGWTKYHTLATNPLPLGGRTTAFPGGTSGNPITYLDYFYDHTGSGNEATIAMTANGTNGRGTLFIYQHTAVPNWVELTDSSAVGFLTDGTHISDAALYPWSYMTAIGDLPKGTWFVTNGVRDTTNCRVARYPNSVSTNYITMATPTATPDLSNAGPFGCASLCAYAERLYAFHTVEGTIPTNRRQPNRLRWTRPGWSTYASTVWQSDTNLGAGYQDLLFCPGEGVAVKQIGRSIACYLSKGVVILRVTGELRPVHSLVYASSARGLLGTKAVADLGGGVHFGAFEDGFWFLTETGEWHEAGIATEGGLRYRKFTDAFFAALYKPSAYRITLGYDRDRRLIYITFPSGGATTFATWIYDIDLDEMYPQDWDIAASTGTAQTARAFAFVDKGTTQAGSCLIHGGSNGFIWEHTPNTYLRNGVNVPWSYATPNIDFGLTTQWQNQESFWADVQGHGVATTLTYVLAGQGGVTQTRQAAAGTTGIRQVIRFPVTGGGTSSSHSLSANHPVTLYGLAAQVQRVSEAP